MALPDASRRPGIEQRPVAVSAKRVGARPRVRRVVRIYGVEIELALDTREKGERPHRAIRSQRMVDHIRGPAGVGVVDRRVSTQTVAPVRAAALVPPDAGAGQAAVERADAFDGTARLGSAARAAAIQV